MGDLPAKQWKDAFAEVNDFTHIIVDNGISRGKKISKDTAKGIFASQGSQLESLVGGTAGSPKIMNALSTTDYRWAKASPGVYRWNGQNYTASEDKEWIYEWISPNWVLKAMGDRIKGADGKSITDWAAQAYSNGAQVFYDKRLFELAPGQSAVAADVPGTSVKWIEKVGGAKLNVADGALGFNEAMAGKVTEDIPVPRIGQFYNMNGGNGAAGWYNSSQLFDVNLGDTVTVKSATENLNNPAIAVFKPDGTPSLNEFIPYEELNKTETHTYVATQARKIGINFRATPVAGDIKIKTSVLYLKPSDIDSTSSIGVASKKSVDDLYKNSKDKTETLTYKNIGMLRADGSLHAGERLYQYSDPIRVKAGKKITIVMRNRENGGSNVAGWLLNNDLSFKSAIINQRRIEPINETSYIYESTITPDADGFLVAQTHSMNPNAPTPWGTITHEVQTFLTKDNIREDGEYGVASQEDMKLILNNGGVTEYPNSIFKNLGIMGGTGGVNPTITKMRYTERILVPKGSTLSAQVAPELHNEVSPQAIAIIFDSTGESVIGRINETQLGINNISYEATENVNIVLNHNMEEFPLKARVTVTRPKIYAPYGSSGGGGGGTGKYIPDVTRFNPVDLIRIDLTTTDPIPTAKGQYMQGNGKLLIDGIERQFHMRFEPQGSSSMSYPEKNWTIELFKDSTLSQDVKIRIANLLPHSEYVLKVNYIDPNHVCNITANRVWEQMLQTREGFPKRDTDQRLIGKTGAEAMETGATGHVDGFPAIFYRNNEFYGIGTFNIGKKYQNYDLTKDDPNHTQFELGNAVDYNILNGIELRNPKVATPEVTAVLNKFKAIASTPLENANTVFKAGFVTSNIVDMYLFLDFFRLVDCLSRNNHWMTYDGGVKWLCTPYDLDTWYKSWNGGNIESPLGRIFTLGINVPKNTEDFWNLKVSSVYDTEIKTRYRQLRDMGIFSADNVYNIMRDLSTKFTRELYQLDMDKWPGKTAWSMGVLEISKWIRTRISYLDGEYGY
ncbi:CotH kinase family protein [Sphingobacterium cellulitidis]|uniref:CotH kinase family protein n=1 Tax=Sphingobacterium cellulitidis TaxID=1768011 RepID=UPI00370D8E70